MPRVNELQLPCLDSARSIFHSSYAYIRSDIRCTRSEQKQECNMHGLRTDRFGYRARQTPMNFGRA